VTAEIATTMSAHRSAHVISSLSRAMGRSVPNEWLNLCAHRIPSRWPSSDATRFPRVSRLSGTMPCSRVSSSRSRAPPAASRAFRNRKRISCCSSCVATGRAPRNHLVFPFVVHTVVASSHRPKPASFQRRQTLNMFRPRGFSPPRRFAPPTASRACCIPLPTLRFTGLPKRGAHACDASSLFPRCQTLQSVPLHLQPRTRHRACVPPCRWRRADA
jgi:hypothetical protein